MISLKRKQSGFTIVELLIVIVVIGILAAIVIVTFTGVQKKARDSERKADINGTYSQLEVYFADNAKYPAYADVSSAYAVWREANLKDLKDDVITPPGQTATQLAASGATTGNYVYAVTNDAGTACDNAPTNLCTKYTLTATLESGGTFDKTGSNN